MKNFLLVIGAVLVLALLEPGVELLIHTLEAVFS